MRAKSVAKAKTHFLANDNLSSIIEPADPREAAFTATKVVITIGPACQEVDQLAELLKSGTSCCRIDLTWGTIEFHRRSLRNLQEAMRKTRKLCAIALDTIGREIIINREVQIDERGWPVHEGKPFRVEKGDKITITTASGGKVDQEAGVLPISYPGFPGMVQKGDTVFLGRYLVTGSEDSSTYLTVDEITEEDVICTARTAATLDGLLTVFHTERSPEGVSNRQNDLDILCEQDRQMITALAKEFELDFVSLSFTRAGEDVESARDFLDSIGLGSTKILAKCETRQALYNFRAIATAADGIVLSRGNLGLDLLPEKIALVQKAVCAACNALGKPVLLTRVMDSTVVNPRPTRAEATDVANAVLDGVDGILLGAETLRGLYPRAVVETTLHICKQAEKVFDHREHFDRLMQDAQEASAEAQGLDDEPSSASFRTQPRSVFSSQVNSETNLHGLGLGSAMPSANRISDNHRRAAYLQKLESIASSAVRAADKVNASLIIVFTQTGTTAALMSKYRPPMPIMTLVVPQLKTDGMKWRLEGRATARQCLIERGLLPVLAAPSPSGDTLLGEAVALASSAGIVQAGDHVVVVQMVATDFVVKIVSVDQDGETIAAIRPKSLLNIVRASQGPQGEDVNTDEQALASGTGAPGHALLAQNLAQNRLAMPEPALGGNVMSAEAPPPQENGSA